MGEEYEHLGWAVSPYTAKTRAYLKFKRIPHRERTPSAWELKRRIEPAVGSAIMPTLVTPDGDWLQDTSAIIDELETRFPSPSVVPVGPTQRLASALLEVYSDEWLPMLALHHRWNNTENKRFATAEFARYGFPKLPGFLGRKLADQMGAQMRRYMPMHGIEERTIPAIEAFGEALIARLDAHLLQHDYLLGGRPCIGDFALFGPLWAHLYRDPGSTSLFDGCDGVVAWFERLVSPDARVGEFLADDEVPVSLDDLFRTLFAEQLPYLEKLVAKIDSYCDEHPDATRVPRALGTTDFTVGGVSGTRRLITFTQWKAQRAVDVCGALNPDERAVVDGWLDRVGGSAFSTFRIVHPFERVDFRVRLRP